MADGSQLEMHASTMDGISYLNPVVCIEPFIFTPYIFQDLLPVE
jgi:hypothetical protein